MSEENASQELFLAVLDYGYDGYRPIGAFSSEEKAWAALGRTGYGFAGKVWPTMLDAILPDEHR